MSIISPSKSYLQKHHIILSSP